MLNLNETYFPASIIGKGFLVVLDNTICVVTHTYTFDDQKMCITYVPTNDIDAKDSKLVNKNEILKVWITN